MERADGTPPVTLTCVLLEPNHVGAVPSAFLECLQTPVEDAVAVLVPDATRTTLMRAVVGTSAVAGPTVAWQRAALLPAALALSEVIQERPLDTEDHLAALVLTGDALADLRAQGLALLGGNERLRQTLRSWLLHQGRRDAVAADLFVHPQTVRNRMGADPRGLR